MNGNTLKLAFLAVVFTLCGTFLVCTVGVAFKHIEMSIYVQLLGEVGFVGFFTMIGQAFIHSNMNTGDTNAKTMPILSTNTVTTDSPSTDKPNV